MGRDRSCWHGHWATEWGSSRTWERAFGPQDRGTRCHHVPWERAQASSPPCPICAFHTKPHPLLAQPCSLAMPRAQWRARLIICRSGLLQRLTPGPPGAGCPLLLSLPTSWSLPHGIPSSSITHSAGAAAGPHLGAVRGRSGLSGELVPAPRCSSGLRDEGMGRARTFRPSPDRSGAGRRVLCPADS